MSSSRLHRWSFVPVAAVVAVASLAGAAPVRAGLDAGTLSIDQLVYDGGFDCDVVGHRPNPPAAEFRDDGITAAQQLTVTAVASPASNPTDTTDLVSSVDAWARATPLDGATATLEGRMRLNAGATSRLPASVCSGAFTKATSLLTTHGTLPRPMWATVTVTGGGTGAATGSLTIDTDLGPTGIEVTPRTRGSLTVLLPAGNIGFWIVADAGAIAQDRAPEELDMAFTVTFLPPGHPSSVLGRGAAYVALGARSCADGSITAALTRKAARKARKVVVSVNGTRVLTAKGRKIRKRALALPAPRQDAAEVTVRVVTRKGRTLEATRHYEAC